MYLKISKAHNNRLDSFPGDYSVTKPFTEYPFENLRELRQFLMNSFGLTDSGWLPHQEAVIYPFNIDSSTQIYYHKGNYKNGYCLILTSNNPIAYEIQYLVLLYDGSGPVRMPCRLPGVSSFQRDN